VRPPPTAEMPAPTVGVGVSIGAQEAMKEAVREGPSVQVGSAAGGGSRPQDTAIGGPDTIKAEVVSISSGEPFDMAEVPSVFVLDDVEELGSWS
jgi:hypothetical protein